VPKEKHKKQHRISPEGDGMIEFELPQDRLDFPQCVSG